MIPNLKKWTLVAEFKAPSGNLCWNKSHLMPVEWPRPDSGLCNWPLNPLWQCLALRTAEMFVSGIWECMPATGTGDPFRISSRYGTLVGREQGPYCDLALFLRRVHVCFETCPARCKLECLSDWPTQGTAHNTEIITDLFIALLLKSLRISLFNSVIPPSLETLTRIIFVSSWENLVRG